MLFSLRNSLPKQLLQDELMAGKITVSQAGTENSIYFSSESAWSLHDSLIDYSDEGRTPSLIFLVFIIVSLVVSPYSVTAQS